MFAVIKTGGKQYRVAAEDGITIAKLDAQPGDDVTFGEVLMFSNENGIEVGGPTRLGRHGCRRVGRAYAGQKVIAFKKRRRQNSRRKRGHRQDFTVVRITDILTGGARPAQAAPVEAARAGRGGSRSRPEAAAASTTLSRRSPAPRARRRPRAASRPPSSNFRGAFSGESR